MTQSEILDPMQFNSPFPQRQSPWIECLSQLGHHRLLSIVYTTCWVGIKSHKKLLCQTNPDS